MLSIEIAFIFNKITVQNEYFESELRLLKPP